jgi:hypothetical protein
MRILTRTGSMAWALGSAAFAPCGILRGAGIGEFLIALQREAANPAHATLISRISVNTFARATTDGDGMKWVNVEDPSLSNNLAQTGITTGKTRR